MEKEQKNIWQICFIASCTIIVILIIWIITISGNGNNKVNSSKNSVIRYGEKNYSNIKVEEEISDSGDIENLENMRWENVRIIQNDGTAKVSMTIRNDNPEQKIENKHLKIELLDIDGNVLAEGNSDIIELTDSNNFTEINFSAGIPSPEVIYNLRVVAEQNN